MTTQVDQSMAIVTERAEKLVTQGELAEALATLTAAMRQFGSRTEIVTLAAATWVSAVDQGLSSENWPEEDRRFLQRTLILHEDYTDDMAVFHHRIAAHHSSGVKGFLGKAAKHVEPTLLELFKEKQVSKNAVLMALLLRKKLARLDQATISNAHLQRFQDFSEADLHIPYSAIFDTRNFTLNIADLKAFVRKNDTALVAGFLPLTHLLFLYWLIPEEFVGLDPAWAEKAVRARRHQDSLGENELAAIRSMALRFGFRPDREDGPTDFAGWATAFSELAEKVSAVRKYVDQEASGSISASKNPDSLPRQIVATVKNTVSTAFPVFSRSTRRLRVAVCVSGQLRGFRSTVPTWRKLLTNTDATFFVDTWKKTGRGTPEPFRYVLPFEGEHFCAEYRSIGTELGLETLRERYPVLFSRFEESGEVTAEGLAEIYKTPHVRVDCETEPMFRDLSNSEKMHLKVEQCHAMMEQSGAEFDVVVRIRPDKPITAVAFDWPDLVDALKATPCLYGETQMGTHYGALLMGDQFAVGLPGVSRVYSTTYSQSREFFQHQLYKMEPRLTGHSSFAQICWLHGIEVRKVPIKFGDFREAEKMPAQEIRHALERDCANRMDKNDNRLLAAISADCDG